MYFSGHLSTKGICGIALNVVWKVGAKSTYCETDPVNNEKITYSHSLITTLSVESNFTCDNPLKIDSSTSKENST